MLLQALLSRADAKVKKLQETFQRLKTESEKLEVSFQAWFLFFILIDGYISSMWFASTTGESGISFSFVITAI